MNGKGLLILVLSLLFGGIGVGNFYQQYREYEEFRLECERQMTENRAEFERMKENYENGRIVIYKGEEMSWNEYVNAINEDRWEELRQMIEEADEEKVKNEANGVMYFEDYMERGIDAILEERENQN